MNEVGLGLSKNADETWRQACIRYAGKHGLAVECAEAFSREIAAGASERDAAFHALSEWDCLDLYIDGKPQP